MKALKIIGYIFGSLFILLVCLGLGIRLYSNHLSKQVWPPPLEGVRLEPTRPHLAEEEVGPDNAYYFIRRMPDFGESAFPEEIRDEILLYITKGEMPDERSPLLERWSKENQDFVDLLEAAAEAEFSQTPTPDAFDFTIPYISTVLRTGRFLAYFGALEARDGDWPSAWYWYNLGLQTGDAVSPGGALVNHLVTFAVHDVLLSAMRRSAVHTPPPEELSREIISALFELTDNMEPYAEAMRYERIFGLSALDLVYRDPNWATLDVAAALTVHDESETASGILGRWGGRLLLWMGGSTPDRTRRHLDAVYSYLIASAEGREIADEKQKRFEDLVQPRVRNPAFYLANPLGRFLVAMLFPAYDGANVRAIHSRMNPEATATVLALQWYRSDHNGRYPETLEELIPDYLPRLPMDRYNPGAPLRYMADADTFRLYSIGPNKQDNGGMHNYYDFDTDREQSDLIFWPLS